MTPSVASVASVAGWPSPLGDAALHGIAGEFVRLVGPHTEADPAALLFSFLAAAGNSFGASAHVLVDADRHPAKLWPVLVGSTASGRKGTSLGWAERVVEQADPSWVARRAANVGSGEVLVWECRDAVTTAGKDGKERTDQGITDKRLFVAESEFAGLLRVAGRDGSTLSSVLRQAWDRDVLRHTVKTNPATATGAHITVVGHVTPEELARELNRTERANGFANRFMWVMVRRSKSLPRGGSLPITALDPLSARLATLIDFGRSVGRVTMDGGYWDVYEDYYEHLVGDRPGMLGAVLGRAAPYVHRLALVYALLDGVSVLSRRHALAAVVAWRYCEQSAAHVFGKSLGDPIADEILRVLGENPSGMTRTQIRDLFHRHRSVGAALDLIRQSGEAYCKYMETDGRPAELWRIGDDEDDATEATEATEGPVA